MTLWRILHKIIYHRRPFPQRYRYRPRKKKAPKKKVAESWYETYSHEKVPVIADVDQELVDWWGVKGWPSFILLDEDLTILQNDSYIGVFDMVEELLEN